MKNKKIKPRRDYKDRIFCILCRDKRVLLEIYNSINQSSYENPDDLIITTLENAIYLGMKNDVSFLLDSRLSLYEHQSTKNPNMPLRDLFYVADVYSELVSQDDLYLNKLQKIPEPHFITFYNGTAPMPDEMTLRLSEAFEHVAGGECENVEAPQLELIVKVLNINKGHNQKLLESSRSLRDYSSYVEKVLIEYK